MPSFFPNGMGAQSGAIQPQQVKNLMQRTANWQIAHFQDLYSGRIEPHHPLAWTNAALYLGMEKWA
ncbi:MAG: hypothetical protein AAF804_18060 [Bacteroidota bacterium]